jgi:hypothetical protein
LTLKKVGFIGIKKYLLLCAPVSITDVAVVYENLFSLDGKYKIENKAIPFLGHIAFAALKGTPLLIILSSEKNIANPTFINFADVKSVNDETKLRSACCLSICTNKSDYKFTAASSVDYQIWIQAFEEAYKISRNVLTSINCTPSLIGGLVGAPGANENDNYMNYSSNENNSNRTILNKATENVNDNPYRSSFLGPNPITAPSGGILSNTNFAGSRNSLIVLPSSENDSNSNNNINSNNGELIQSPHASKTSLIYSTHSSDKKISNPNSHNNSLMNFPYNKSGLNINENNSLINDTQQQPTLGRLFTNAPTRLENQSHILDDLSTQEDDEEDDNGSNLDTTIDETDANESSMITESSLEPSECFNSYRNFNTSISHNSPRIYDYKYATTTDNKEHNESFNIIKTNDPNSYSFVYNNTSNNNNNKSMINYGNDIRSSNSIKNNSQILQMPPSTPQRNLINEYNIRKNEYELSIHNPRSPIPMNPSNHIHRSHSLDSDDENNDDDNFETTTETESITEYDSSYNNFPSIGNNYVPPPSHINSRSSIRSFSNINPIMENKNHIRTRSNHSFHYIPTSVKQ